MSATTASFQHTPVLLQQVVTLLAPALRRPNAVVVDCTLGGAGHASALLEREPGLTLIGIDRDQEALAAAAKRLAPFKARSTLIHGAFADLGEHLEKIDIDKVDAIYADFGVSSYQLDCGERGFSFRAEAPLDMRMDRSQGDSVAEFLESTDEQTLYSILRNLGEEKFSRRVARAIIQDQPQTTTALASLVERVIPFASRRHEKIHPATRTFQALRMHINSELPQIKAWLEQATEHLLPGGIVAAISFHSLEDRVVKHSFRDQAIECICPPMLPQCGCGHVAKLKVLTRKAWTATAQELDENPRARSAKLRGAIRLGELPNA